LRKSADSAGGGGGTQARHGIVLASRHYPRRLSPAVFVAMVTADPQALGRRAVLKSVAAVDRGTHDDLGRADALNVTPGNAGFSKIRPNHGRRRACCTRTTQTPTVRPPEPCPDPSRPDSHPGIGGLPGPGRQGRSLPGKRHRTRRTAPGLSCQLRSARGKSRWQRPARTDAAADQTRPDRTRSARQAGERRACCSSGP
jgi:hypothetical protein